MTTSLVRPADSYLRLPQLAEALPGLALLPAFDPCEERMLSFDALKA